MQNKLIQLQSVLRQLKRVTVAVSGGVDSMTLAFIAHKTLADKAIMIHAVSPAVPPADTQRIQDYAQKYGWELKCVQSGEMEDSTYRENPVNRCYFCKKCLYNTLTAFNHGQVISGTNLDDLSDYRPGLIAAKENDIRHPFVEVNIDKQTIRAIASHYGLQDIATLPASPCLASRIETGIFIIPSQLDLINRVETKIRREIVAENIRCRLQSQKIVIEVDEMILNASPQKEIDKLKFEIELMVIATGLTLPVHFSAYQRGSAFLGAE